MYSIKHTPILYHFIPIFLNKQYLVQFWLLKQKNSIVLIPKRGYGKFNLTLNNLIQLTGTINLSIKLIAEHNLVSFLQTVFLNDTNHLLGHIQTQNIKRIPSKTVFVNPRCKIVNKFNIYNMNQSLNNKK